MFSIEVVDLYGNEDAIITSSYKETKFVKKIEKNKGIENLLNDILDLHSSCFGRRMFNYIPDNVIIAFNEKNKIIGYCGLDFNNGLHIESLCVDKDSRLKGVGRCILEKAYEVGKQLNKNYPSWIDHIDYDYGFNKDDLTYLILEVSNDYDDFNFNSFRGLLNFYEKCGFKKNNIRVCSEVCFKKVIN
jgi:GNAT superfamily N-acetyltransferase